MNYFFGVMWQKNALRLGVKMEGTFLERDLFFLKILRLDLSLSLFLFTLICLISVVPFNVKSEISFVGITGTLCSFL